jgi:cytochrome c peroxidase
MAKGSAMTARLLAAAAAVFLLSLLTASTQEVGVQAQVEGGSRAQLHATVALGRLLFWDPILSGHRDVACATCHHPDFAYADGRDISLGVGAVGLGPARADRSNGAMPAMRRNSQTILNTAFNGDDRRRGRGRGRRRGRALGGIPVAVNQAGAPMFWDSRARSLEAQALEPIKALEEMRGTAYSEAEALNRVVARLRDVPEYVDLFREAFGEDAEIDASRLGQAIAAFERTLVATNSPFDRFQAGDPTALTAAQQRGLTAFRNADCDQCHDGPMLSDFDLHAEGVGEHPTVAEADTGDGRFRFRTPTLRNVALTAPYMHNGTLATLEDVLRFYDDGRSLNPNVSTGRRRGGVAQLDRNFRGVNDMTDAEMRDIVAFLEALTDPDFDRTIPARVPSGLPPGGLIGG